ncbi:MAG: PQQ-dependent sugar dehydrogenase [Chitinophagaceae bacterium]
MKKTIVFLLVSCIISGFLYGQEVFAVDSINRTLTPVGSRYYLAHPYEISYGPDDSLYITEKIGRVRIVSSLTGVSRIILDYRSNIYLNISRNGSGVATSIGQNGMMGLALHKNFKQATGEDYIYIAYSYNSTSLRISRFTYNIATGQLGSEFQLINGISAGGDHSSGRLFFGVDDKLYYSCGDQGANQFASRCNPILAQETPTQAELAASNYTKYQGKVLRINLNGTIPADNPLFDPDGGGPEFAVRSHVFTLGHRNPQGLVFEMNPNDGNAYRTLKPSGFLYSSEHGVRTDDEINILSSGNNYAWPYWAGFRNNPAQNYRYINWSSATGGNCSITSYNEVVIPTGATVMQESAFSAGSFTDPIFSMYPACNGAGNCNVTLTSGTNWMQYPTVAPSSIDHYGFTNIPGWYQSLLIPTLRRGTLYRFKLNAARNGIVNDSVSYFFRTDRYRDLAIKNGNIIFTITDSIGSTSGPSGGGTSALSRPGTILKYTFLGYQNNGTNNKSTLPTSIDVTDGPVNTNIPGSTVVINASNSNYWVPLTGPDGNILAEIFANGNVLGTVTSCFYKNSGPVRSQNGSKYLDRNITITPQFQPSSPVRIRLYFSKAEFDALDADPVSGISSINDIRILKNNDGCGSAVSGATSLVNPVYAEIHTTNSSYVVQANISAFSTFYFGSSNLTLPLSLVKFSGKRNKNVVELKWETETERNTDYFVIERNTGSGFVSIGTVPAGINTNMRSYYNYTDADLSWQLAPVTTYRLKINDKNDMYSYSVVISISADEQTDRITIFPNPVSTGEAKVSIAALSEGLAHWKLLDNAGRTVMSNDVQLRPGNNDMTINVSALSSGLYFLSIVGQGIDQKVKFHRL